MQDLLARSWSADHDAELDEASVRAAFLPPEKYRISRYHYPAGTTTGGSMIRGVCFVLKGECQFTFRESVVLRSGQFAELPGGSYELAAQGPGDLELVLVWEIPLVGGNDRVKRAHPRAKSK
jgi:hypothetical protein